MKDVYVAVADPTRRKLIRLLADAKELPLHELTAQFQMGRSAVSKHLSVLKDAHLVLDRKVGRETRYRLNPIPLREIGDWVSYYQQFWTNQMAALNQMLQEDQEMADISLDLQINNSIKQVWFALTDSDTLAQWLMDNDFKPVVGHEFQYRTEPTPWMNGIIDCKVLKVDEPHQLSYTWVSGSEDNTVIWTLNEATDGTTNLHLQQTGISGGKQTVAGAKYGWKRTLSKLEKVISRL